MYLENNGEGKWGLLRSGISGYFDTYLSKTGGYIKLFQRGRLTRFCIVQILAAHFVVVATSLAAFSDIELLGAIRDST